MCPYLPSKCLCSEGTFNYNTWYKVNNRYISNRLMRSSLLTHYHDFDTISTLQLRSNADLSSARTLFMEKTFVIHRKRWARGEKRKIETEAFQRFGTQVFFKSQMLHLVKEKVLGNIPWNVSPILDISNSHPNQSCNTNKIAPLNVSASYSHRVLVVEFAC